MTHAADIKSSARLQAVLGVLADGKPHTTAEIAGRTGSVAIHSDVSEIRAGGIPVTCRYVGLTSARRKVYEYQTAGH